MSKLFHNFDEPQYVCLDRSHYHNIEDQMKYMVVSKTIYVGNLSFFTTEVQLEETFSVVGPVKRFIMGLNSQTKQPCGFCFIEYYTREHAEACLKYLSGTVCDDRVIRCDLDAGFKPGRQYGRGKSGGQVRDERRKSYDMDRGGIIDSSLGKRGRIVEFASSSARNEAENIGNLLERGLSASRSAPTSAFKSNISSNDDQDNETISNKRMRRENEE